MIASKKNSIFEKMKNIQAFTHSFIQSL